MAAASTGPVLSWALSPHMALFYVIDLCSSGWSQIHYGAKNGLKGRA